MRACDRSGSLRQHGRPPRARQRPTRLHKNGEEALYDRPAAQWRFGRQGGASDGAPQPHGAHVRVPDGRRAGRHCAPGRADAAMDVGRADRLRGGVAPGRVLARPPEQGPEARGAPVPDVRLRVFRRLRHAARQPARAELRADDRHPDRRGRRRRRPVVPGGIDGPGRGVRRGIVRHRLEGGGAVGPPHDLPVTRDRVPVPAPAGDTGLLPGAGIDPAAAADRGAEPADRRAERGIGKGDGTGRGRPGRDGSGESRQVAVSQPT